MQHMSSSWAVGDSVSCLQCLQTSSLVSRTSTDRLLESDRGTGLVQRGPVDRASLEPVLRLFVPPQVHFPLETFAAEVAAERFVSGVFPAVRDEVGALAERFATHLAFVGLLTWKKKQHIYDKALVGVILHLTSDI